MKGRGLAGKVKLVTFDSSDQLRQDLRDGVIDAMVVQDPQLIGYEAVRTLVEKLNGKQPAEAHRFERQGGPQVGFVRILDSHFSLLDSQFWLSLQ